MMIAFLPLLVMAQEKKVDFFGSGRFALNNGNMSGELTKTDTVTPQKQMRGNTLFDLGFHIRPSSETEIKAITRVSNDMNGFWGAGVLFNVRELYLRGLLLKRFKYQVGDLNTRMSAYTLYNNDAELSSHNPVALNTFSEVIEYDKFYVDHAWRQQGAMVDFGFDFEKYLNHLQVKTLISKNRQTDYFSSPDRLFSGTTVGAKLFKQLNLEYNLAHTFDVKNSAMFSDALFKNTVHSFGLKEKFDLGKHGIELSAEFGKSKVVYENNITAPIIPDGKFAEAGVYWKSKQSGLSATINVRNVETHFRSMGAQSRRVDFSATASEYAYYTNRETPRPANIMDILTDGAYYSLFLRPELKQFNPSYENMMPYGKATPNRQGFDASISWDAKKLQGFKVGLAGASFNEITGQGTLNLRNFTQLETFADLGISELYKGKRKLGMSAYVRIQNTMRDGTENIDKVDLKTQQFKIGVSYEIIPKLSLQVAAVQLIAKGNEYLAERNSFNEINFYTAYTAQLKETFWTGGINYQFSKANSLKLQWQQVNWNNELLPANQYKINRFAVLYNLFF